MTTTVKQALQGELKDIADAGLTKSERIITSPQDSHITVQGGQEVLNFCANNYLGLANHPKLIEAAHKALDDRGYGLASVRFICGTQDIHKELEARIAEFLGMEDSILYASCFDANGGLFEVLLGPEDAIISDELNHASIIDGIRLCKAKRFRFLHMDMVDLEAKLKEARENGARRVMIATDGVFSMDGDIAPLGDICDLAEKYDAMVMIDDCHATGFLGKGGRGSWEHCGVGGRIDIITSTLGKALGGASGGFTAASNEVVELLRQRSRPYLFSNSVAPTLVAASIACLDLLTSTTELRDRLEANTTRFREAMVEAGFDIRGETPIAPVMLGDARLAMQMADALLKEGIYVIGFSYPVVPKGKARIRTQISAAHTREDVERAIEAFLKVGRDLKLI
jgi:glycine C-acetyltransferase